MDMKNVEKGAKLLAEYKAIEAEIKQINKVAMLAANKRTSSCFTLLVTDDELAEKLTGVSREEYENGAKSISFFIEKILTGLKEGKNMLDDENFENPQEKVHVHLDNSNCLEILGIVLRDRNDRKVVLRKQIKDLGINIE